MPLFRIVPEEEPTGAISTYQRCFIIQADAEKAALDLASAINGDVHVFKLVGTMCNSPFWRAAED